MQIQYKVYCKSLQKHKKSQHFREIFLASKIFFSELKKISFTVSMQKKHIFRLIAFSERLGDAGMSKNEVPKKSHP